MKTLSIEIRRAEPDDARAISNAHRSAWQQAYEGLIPHKALRQMVDRRDEAWWRKAARGSATMLVVEVAGVVAGYTTLGLSRARGLPYDGEVYELYLRPEYQGMGLGSSLFLEARRLLKSLGCNGVVVWCLEDSDVANRFFRSHGGRDVAEGMEDFAGTQLRKLGFAWR
jgi:ribosomal protein S18 acetylase RimI-like enzyme